MKRFFVSWNNLFGIAFCAAVLAGAEAFAAEQTTVIARNTPCVATGLRPEGRFVVAKIDCHDGRSYYSDNADIITLRGTTKRKVVVFCTRYKYRDAATCGSSR